LLFVTVELFRRRKWSTAYIAFESANIR
jgi:hypothetical protein